MKIHHVGIACRNIEKAICSYGKLFHIVSQTDIVFDPEQNANLCLVKTDTGLDVEFISGEQVAGLLKTHIPYYHLCYEVDSIESTIRSFEEGGAFVVSSLKPAVLFSGKRVAFLMTKTGLIELLEKL